MCWGAGPPAPCRQEETEVTRRRSSLAIVAALAVTLAFVPVVEGPVRAASTFTFHGSGYGHGIGMSQWGAYGLAKMGWSHRRILTHFYRETHVERLGTLPVTIRVGLTSGRSLVHLRSTGGPVKLWEGRPSEGTPIGTIAPEETWTVTAKDGDHAVRDGSGALVGTRWGSSQEHLYVTFPGPGSGVFVPEADAIWSEGFTYTRGVLEFNLHGCGAGAGCAERLIAQVSLEEYLYGLGEVPASWPMESLEAQAVAARSYAVAGMRSGLRADCNCHLSDGAGDQVYVGADRELGLRGERWIRAVDATRSQVVTHEGAVVQAFYAASDGGHTEDVENVWHGGDDAYAIPWLRGVCDPGESTLANPWNDWTRSFDAATVTSRLATYTGSIGTIVSFGDVRRGTSGRILTAVANGASGSATVTGNEIQAALGLPDDRVWINADRSVTGPLRESYDGLMCAPGLPVSATSAVPGGTQQLFTDGGLYRNAALDLTLWLRGALDHEYRALGAAAGVLGLPVGDARALRTAGAGTTLVCEDCRRVDFAGGRIYLTDGIGARALWGRVLKTYLRARGIGGALGSPVTRVRRIPGGGAQAAFEGGRISCPLGAPCTVVLG
jgi:SpoIID/LytB domain protein